jgi:hypothetical protein
MTSIGGLDVAFGARMQVVRTNVMCLALASTGLANATTVPKFILNTYKEALKGTVIEPDFLYIYEVADLDGSGFTTAAVANSLFNQDNSGDGTADTTALEVNGILRDIQQCPLAVNSAFADTTATNAAEGDAHTLHTYDNIHGNLALESVLSLSAMGLADTAADLTAGVFSDAADADVDAESGFFPQQIQALAFKEVYDNATASTGGNLDAGSKYTGMHKGPFTVNLLPALTQLETGAGIATGAAAATVDAYTASTTFGTMAADLSSDAGIISLTSFAKVV